ncbi:MAG TPA: cell wall-binding repeat-containing protein [Actinomycetales bacterium]|nr:cell wall-binding repeat-containing protein [Actinomycetales bacterium]
MRAKDHTGRRWRRVVASVAVAATATAGLVALAPSASAEDVARPVDGVLRVKGHGWGHGHGMSQWGAHGAAKKGLTYDKILAFYYPGTTATTQSDLSLTVRVTSDTDSTTEVLGQDGLARASGSGAPVAMPFSAARWRVTTSSDGASSTLQYLSGSSWSTWATSTVPITFSNTKTGRVRLALKDSAGSFFREYIGAVRGVRYNGVHYSVVATTMETYLRGVVPSEMPASWEAEALKSQAVAARTYATYERGDAGSRPYQTCDSTACQVFDGYADYTTGGALRAARTDSRSDAAISATRGRILTYGGKPAFTQFSASNGGYMVAGSQPYLVAKADPYDGVYPSTAHSWTDTVAVSTLEAKYPSIGRLSTLKVQRDGLGEWGGRPTFITVVGNRGSVRVTGDAFASAAGFKHRWWALAEVPRLGGHDRYEVAANVALNGGAFTAPPVVYVVSGDAFADALAGAARAGGLGGPVLLTTPTKLPAATAQALSVLKPAKIVVLGGPTIVAPSVQAALKPYATTGEVQRIYGSDRFATAAMLWDGAPTGGTVYLANGMQFPDALSGAAAAAASGSAVLLTLANRIPDVTASALSQLDPAEIVVLGGPASVTSTVEAQLSSYAPKVTRIGGADRFAVAAGVASTRFSGATRAYVANGLLFPDALAGAALAGVQGAPVLLSTSTALPSATVTALRAVKPESITVLGGPASVSPAVASALGAYAVP